MDGIKPDPALRAEMLEAQFDTAANGVLVVDGNGTTLMANRRFAEMWDIPQAILDENNDEKMLRYVLDKLKYPDLFIQKVKDLYAHNEEKSRDEIEFNDGRYFDRYSAPMTDKTGKYYGRVWYFYDITGQKVMEKAVRQEMAELEKQQAVMMGREKRIIEIKNEVNDLLKKSGCPAKYLQ
jgi:two-component system, cell cycle sensor histidine kinase and response regulator CckA